MIAHVSGLVAEKFGNSVIVDVHGLGYEVQVPAGDFDAALMGEAVKFYTYHHIREQAQDLFGFSSESYFSRYVQKYLGAPPSSLVE